MTKSFLLLLAAACAIAQPGRGPAPVRSPEVSADGKATFRLRAPNATDVAVTGLGPRLAMTKDAQGVWSVTTDTLKPDLYTYMFSVDGATVPDPATARSRRLTAARGTACCGFRDPRWSSPATDRAGSCRTISITRR